MEDEVGWLCLPECSSMIERQTLTESRDCRSPEQNDCPYAACNMSSCEVGEYRKECGHDYPATCATCLNTIPAYSSFSGPADPPTNSTSCPYACWSGFYREPNSEACIPDGAVGGGQFGNISLDGLTIDGLDIYFGFRPSVTFEATMRYQTTRIDDIIQTYREGVSCSLHLLWRWPF